MKSINENEVIEKFLESGRLIEKAICTGDYKLNNRECNKMFKLYKKVIEYDKNIFLDKCVPILLEKGNYSVKIQICNFLFDMHIREKEMEKILIEIANDKNSKLFGHQASLILHSRGIKIKK